MTEDSAYYEPYHYNIRESADQNGKGVHIKITPNSNLQQVILKQTTLIKKLKDQRNRYISTIEERNFIITQMVEKMKEYEAKMQVLSATVVEVLGQEYLNDLFDKESLQKLQAARKQQLNKLKQLKQSNEDLKQELQMLRENKNWQKIQVSQDSVVMLEKVQKENMDLSKKLQSLKEKYKRVKKEMKESRDYVNDIETIQIEEETIQMYEVQCQTEMESKDVKQVKQEIIEETKEALKTELDTKDKLIEDLKREISQMREQANTKPKQTNAQSPQIQNEIEKKAEAQPALAISEKDRLISELEQQIQQLKQSAPDRKKKEKELRKLKAANQKLTSDLETLEFEEEVIQLFEVECQTQPEQLQKQTDKQLIPLTQNNDQLENKKQVIQDLRKQIDYLKESMVEAGLKDKVIQDLRQQITKINEEKAQQLKINTDLQIKESIIEGMKEQISKCKETQCEKNKFIQELRQQIVSLNQPKDDTQLNAKDKLIEELRLEINQMREQATLKEKQEKAPESQKQSKVQNRVVSDQPQVVPQIQGSPIQLTSEKDGLISYLQQQIAELKQSIPQSSPAGEEAFVGSTEKDQVINDLKKQNSRLRKKEKELRKLKAANQKLTTDLETLQFQQETMQLFEVQCQTEEAEGTQVTHHSQIQRLRYEVEEKNKKISELELRINFLNKVVLQLREQSDSILKNLTQSAPVLQQEVSLAQKIKENQTIIKKLQGQIELKEGFIKKSSENLSKMEEFVKWTLSKIGIEQQYAIFNKEEDTQKLKELVSNLVQTRKVQKVQQVAQQEMKARSAVVPETIREDVDSELREEYLTITDLENIPILYIEKIYDPMPKKLNFEPIFISHENMKRPQDPLQSSEVSEQIEDRQQTEQEKSESKEAEIPVEKGVKPRPNLSIDIEQEKPFTLPLMLAPASPKNTINFSPLLTRTEPYYNRNTATQTQFLVSNLKTVQKWKLENLLKSSLKKINLVLSDLEETPVVKQKNLREIANNVGNQSLCQFFNSQNQTGKRN